MYYLLANKVGIFFHKEYLKRFEDAGMNVIAKPSSPKEFKNAEASIAVFYSKDLDTDGCMNDGTCYYSAVRFIDTELGVQIDKKGDKCFEIRSGQDCTEWFMCMLEIALLKADMTFAHCAALEKNGEALFMPARGGVGKTATVVKMVQNHGWRLLGDDLILLNGRDGSVQPYLKQFVIYGYHRDLFPQLFRKGHGPVQNKAVSGMMSRMIPAAKRVLRMTPGLMAYIRKHNPQHIRVYPKDIFRQEMLSEGAVKIRKTVWLERSAADDTVYVVQSADQIASRCASVTLSELTYGKMNLNHGLLTMCGTGLLRYDEIYPRISDIVRSCIEESDLNLLSIPAKVDINLVSDIVFKHVRD